MRPLPALLSFALALSVATPAAAQRAPAAALLAFARPPATNAGPGDRTRSPADTLVPRTSDSRRALWATGGGLAGLAAGGVLGALIVRDDGRPSDQREMDFVGVVALAGIGETIGVTVAAAAPGGRSRGACRGDVRLLRSFLGTAAGTGAVALFASRAPAAYLLLPVGQVTGAVLALGGC
jgi:hypothetical protein